MYKGQKFHIECDVELNGMYLIGTNKNGGNSNSRRCIE